MSAPVRKSLGLWMLTALVAGNAIGSGVFLLPASLAAYGTISILSWSLTSAGVMVLALIFARLSNRLPRTGGPYAYCRAAYGDFVGFQVAYNYWIAVWVGNAAIVVAFVGYLAVFWPALDTTPWLALVACLGALWLLTLVNAIGVRYAGQVQLITTILKLLPLIAIATFGLFFIHAHNLEQFNVSGHSNFSALTAAAALTVWSFIGFESATVPAGDVINPKVNIPRATLLGTGIAALVYIFGTFAIMGILPMSTLAHSSSPYAIAAREVFGPWGHALIAAAAAIACFGTLNGWVLLQGQIPMAAAKDSLFPKAFGRVSKRHGTPVFGLVFSSICVSALLTLRYGASLVSQFTFIILLATLASLIPYLYTSVAEVILYFQDREHFKGQRLLKSAVLAIIGFLFTFWAITGVSHQIVFYGVLLLLSSIPVYAWLVARRPARILEANS